MSNPKGVPFTHGHYINGKETSTHAIWRGMLARCYNPNQKDYPRYGGRGVRVCERWQKFENFLADMGERPPGMSLERKRNNGNYCKSNCKWATRSEQQKNKVNTRRYRRLSDGFIGTPSECADEIGISRALACWRLRQWGAPDRNQWVQV